MLKMAMFLNVKKKTLTMKEMSIEKVMKWI